MKSSSKTEMAKETSVKVSEESPDSQFNLDGILSELGSFGKYQLLLLFLLAFRDSFLAMCNFNYVFTAEDVPYRCVVPECEITDDRFNASWTTFALVNNTRSCYRPEPFNQRNNPSWPVNNGTCSPERFYLNRTMPCERIVYENYNSIVAEFNLGCEPWKRTMIGSVHNLGLVVSFLLSGFISDRYGRKIIIVGTPLAVAIAGLIKSFSVNYWMLLVFEFLETALGYGNASMILSLETVSHKRRVIFSCISDLLSNLGGSFFGLIAWKVPYWRYMMRAIYAPLLVMVFYIFLIDEGVRWLLAHNKNDEAVRVLNKVAKINNITLSKNAKDLLTKISHQTSKENQKGLILKPKSNLLSVLRSKKILLRVVLMAACFFCVTFVYIGTVINSTSLSGNKYVNFSVMLLVAIPTRVIAAFTLTKFGRRAPICVAYCLCALFFITSAFVPKSAWWASVLLYVMGKMCSSYGLFSVSVVAMEVFPTTSRNSLTNTANTIGRLGSTLAPQAPLLEQYMTGLTSIVFGVVSLGPAMLSLLFPDTSNAELPESVHDAERLGDTTVDTNNDTLKSEEFQIAVKEHTTR